MQEDLDIERIISFVDAKNIIQPDNQNIKDSTSTQKQDIASKLLKIADCSVQYSVKDFLKFYASPQEGVSEVLKKLSEYKKILKECANYLNSKNFTLAIIPTDKLTKDAILVKLSSEDTIDTIYVFICSEVKVTDSIVKMFNYLYSVLIYFPSSKLYNFPVYIYRDIHLPTVSKENSLKMAVMDKANSSIIVYDNDYIICVARCKNKSINTLREIHLQLLLKLKYFYKCIEEE